MPSSDGGCCGEPFHSALVLEYLDDNLLDVCGRTRLEGSEVKVVARTVLEALALLHENGFVHTGSSP